MNKIKAFYNLYKKAIVGAAGVVLSAVLTAFLGDGHLDFGELVNIVILACGAVSVGIAANVPGAKYTKAVLAGVAAAATVVLSVASGGITVTEYGQIAVSFLTAAGVLKAKNICDYYDKVGKHAEVQ